YVAKLSPGLDQMLYGTFLGGTTRVSNALGIAVDGAGDAFVVGNTSCTDFPVTAGAFQTTNHGPTAPNGEQQPSGDMFVTKLSPDGTSLLYSTYVGGAADEGNNGGAIAIDGSGNAYITGDTMSDDYPTTAGSFQTTPGGFD